MHSNKYVLDYHDGFFAIDKCSKTASLGQEAEQRMRLTRFDFQGKLVTSFAKSGVLDFNYTTDNLLSSVIQILFHPKS